MATNLLDQRIDYKVRDRTYGAKSGAYFIARGPNTKVSPNTIVQLIRWRRSGVIPLFSNRLRKPRPGERICSGGRILWISVILVNIMPRDEFDPVADAVAAANAAPIGKPAGVARAKNLGENRK